MSASEPIKNLARVVRLDHKRPHHLSGALQAMGGHILGAWPKAGPNSVTRICQWLPTSKSYVPRSWARLMVRYFLLWSCLFFSTRAVLFIGGFIIGLLLLSPSFTLTSSSSFSYQPKVTNQWVRE